MKMLFLLLVLMPTIMCSAQNILVRIMRSGQIVRLGLPFDKIPADVPINDFLKAGDVLGFREFFGTNKTENVYATWAGADMIEFSNGIGLATEDKTIGEIIQDMADAIETMYQPSSALDDALHLVSTNPPKYERMHSANEALNQIKARHERLQKMGYKRVWYFKRNK